MKRLAILLLAAVVTMAQSPMPTPVQPARKPAYDPTPPVRYQPPVAAGWQRFQGAKRCEQVGNTLTCDNGYKQTVR